MIRIIAVLLVVVVVAGLVSTSSRMAESADSCTYALTDESPERAHAQDRTYAEMQWSIGYSIVNGVPTVDVRGEGGYSVFPLTKSAGTIEGPVTIVYRLVGTPPALCLDQLGSVYFGSQ